MASFPCRALRCPGLVLLFYSSSIYVVQRDLIQKFECIPVPPPVDVIPSTLRQPNLPSNLFCEIHKDSGPFALRFRNKSRPHAILDLLLHDPRIERHVSQELDARIIAECPRAGCGAEDVGWCGAVRTSVEGHVLDEAENGDVEFFEGGDALLGIFQGEGVRRGDNEST